MTLRDIINNMYDDPSNVSLPIIYRTHGPHGEDLLAGKCRWENEELISEDGDTYSLDDEVNYYEFRLDYSEEENIMTPYLVVWYISRWMNG